MFEVNKNLRDLLGKESIKKGIIVGASALALMGLADVKDEANHVNADAVDNNTTSQYVEPNKQNSKPVNVLSNQATKLAKSNAIMATVNNKSMQSNDAINNNSNNSNSSSSLVKNTSTADATMKLGAVHHKFNYKHTRMNMHHLTHRQKMQLKRMKTVRRHQYKKHVVRKNNKLKRTHRHEHIHFKKHVKSNFKHHMKLHHIRHLKHLKAMKKHNHKARHMKRRYTRVHAHKHSSVEPQDNINIPNITPESSANTIPTYNPSTNTLVIPSMSDSTNESTSSSASAPVAPSSVTTNTASANTSATPTSNNSDYITNGVVSIKKGSNGYNNWFAHPEISDPIANEFHINKYDAAYFDDHGFLNVDNNSPFPRKKVHVKEYGVPWTENWETHAELVHFHNPFANWTQAQFDANVPRILNMYESSDSHIIGVNPDISVLQDFVVADPNPQQGVNVDEEADEV